MSQIDLDLLKTGYLNMQVCSVGQPCEEAENSKRETVIAKANRVRNKQERIATECLVELSVIMQRSVLKVDRDE